MAHDNEFRLTDEERGYFQKIFTSVELRSDDYGKTILEYMKYAFNYDDDAVSQRNDTARNVAEQVRDDIAFSEERGILLVMLHQIISKHKERLEKNLKEVDEKRKEFEIKRMEIEKKYYLLHISGIAFRSVITHYSGEADKRRELADFFKRFLNENYYPGLGKIIHYSNVGAIACGYGVLVDADVIVTMKDVFRRRRDRNGLWRFEVANISRTINCTLVSQDLDNGDDQECNAVVLRLLGDYPERNAPPIAHPEIHFDTKRDLGSRLSVHPLQRIHGADQPQGQSYHPEQRDPGLIFTAEMPRCFVGIHTPKGKLVPLERLHPLARTRT